jgi:superfamily II DNA or RNA helicase
VTAVIRLTGTDIVGAYYYLEDGPRGRPIFVVGAKPHIMVKLKRMIPMAYQDPRNGYLWITATRELARDLEWFCERYPLTPYDDRSAGVLAKLADEHRAGEERVARILDGEIPPLDPDRAPCVTPREYQLVPRAMIRAQGFLLLGDDVGLGKTLEASLMFSDLDALRGLVVAPHHLVDQWALELEKYFPWLNTHIVRKGSPYTANQTVLLRRLDQAHVLITNYHKLAGWGDHLRGKMATVIFDEAHELRTGAGTGKYTAAEMVARAARYRVLMTATPVYNYGKEVHHIVSIMAPDVLGTLDEYVREHGGDRTRDPRALGAYLRESGIMLRRTRKEVGRELPPVSIMVQPVETNRHLLDDMIREGIVAMAAKVLSADTDATERWTMSGQLDMKVRHATGVAKAPYIAQFVKMLLESGIKKIGLVGHHHDVYDIWVKELAEYNPVLYTGRQSAPQKKAAVDAFVNGDSRVFIMALRSGAGLNGLQEVSDTVVIGEPDWSPAQHTQVIGRWARDGQENPVAVFFMMSDAGSDPAMEDLLQLKRSIAEPINDPDAEVVQPSPDEALRRVQALARSVLAQHGVHLDQPAMPEPEPGSGELFSAETAVAVRVSVGELVPADAVSGPARDLARGEPLPRNGAGQVPSGMVPYYETQEGLAEVTAAANVVRLDERRRLHPDRGDGHHASRTALKDRLNSGDRS